MRTNAGRTAEPSVPAPADLTASALLERPPFSFRYGERESSALLRHWDRRHRRDSSGDGSVVDVTVWTEADDGLQVTWSLHSYSDTAALRWHVELRNLGSGRSEQLSDVLGIDLAVSAARSDDYLVRTLAGSNCTPADFAVHDLPLPPDSFRLFSCVGGRPTNLAPDLRTDGTFVRNGWPYLNLDHGGGGVIVALGWPGQWGLQTARDGESLTITGGAVNRDEAGQGDTLDELVLADTYLEGGESFTTPLVAVLPWRAGAETSPQNQWRRFLVDHIVPRFHGRPAPPTLSGSHFNLVGTDLDQLSWMDRLGEAGLTTARGGDIETWWIDAGWYRSCGPQERDWVHTGDWDVNDERFPGGLMPVTERGREHGMSTILWFEPERVWLGSELASEHPDWMLRWQGATHLGRTDSAILDFGNEGARSWATSTVNRMLSETGTDRIVPGVPGYYREDFNIDPLPHWNAADVPGRTGMTQIRHCLGHLQFWKDVQEANPDLLIDTCASGGRRLDLLTLTLSVPLLRSDLIGPAEVAQRQHFGIARWLPVSGNQSPAGVDVRDGYAHRSAFAPMWMIPLHVDDPRVDLSEAAALTQEWRAITPTYLGDFHPLAADDAGDLLAWQQSARDGSVIAVQTFNRGHAGAPITTSLPLTDVDREAHYRLARYAGTRATWSASAGFGSSQGGDGWSYEFEDDGGARSPGRHMWGTWTWPGWVSPSGITARTLRVGGSVSTIRTWTAPAAGEVTIEDSAFLGSDVEGEIEVEVAIEHDGETLASASLTAGPDGARLGRGLSVSVERGARISFRARLVSGPDWAEAIWDPTITLTTPAEPEITEISGQELADDGLAISMPARSASSAVLTRVAR